MGRAHLFFDFTKNGIKEIPKIADKIHGKVCIRRVS
jgi:hypothetical protein